MTNADFTKLVDTSDEWITARTGIKERRVAENDCAGSDLAVSALRAALAMALDEANREGRIKPGDLVLPVAFGGGLIWGAALVRW